MFAKSHRVPRDPLDKLRKCPRSEVTGIPRSKTVTSERSLRPRKRLIDNLIKDLCIYT